MPDRNAIATTQGLLLPMEDAAREEQVKRALAAMTAIVDDPWIGASARVRAALTLIELAHSSGDEAGGDEPSLMDYLTQLGPREPVTPDELEARARALGLAVG